MLQNMFLLIFLLVPCVYSQVAAPPVNPRVRATSATSLIVTWEIPEATVGVITGFKFLIGKSGYSESAGPTDTSYTFDFRNPFTAYKITIATQFKKADGSHGVSEFVPTEPVEVKTWPSVGPTPTCTAPTVTKDSVTVSWTLTDAPINGELKDFEVTITGPEKFTGTKSVEPQAMTTSFTNLLGHTKYKLSVVAVNKPESVSNRGGGAGLPCNLEVKTLPSAGATPVCKAKLVSSASLTFEWNLNNVINYGDVKAFHLTIEGPGIQSTTEKVDKTVSSYTFSGLQNFTVYNVGVATENWQIRESDQSGGIGAPCKLTMKTVGPTMTCKAPNVRKDSVTVSWTLPDAPINGELKYFEVTITGPEGFTETKILEPLAMTTSFTKLTAFTEYSISVVAVNKPDSISNQGGGAGLTCNLEVKTLPSGAPPVNPRVRATSDTSLIVTWEIPKEPHGVVKGFKFRLGKSGYSDSAGPTDTSYTFNLRKPFTAYNITIATEYETADGLGDVSEFVPTEPVEVKTWPSVGPLLTCQAPTVTNDSVTVSWTLKDGPIDGELNNFEVTITGPEGFTETKSLEPTAMTTSFTNLLGLTKYTFSVVAVNKPESVSNRGGGAGLPCNFYVETRTAGNTGSKVGIILGMVVSVAVAVAI